MARIRTIKPEFWTDEKIVELPYEARLLFIGMWNFCDDDGFLPEQPQRIRMQILPNDGVDAQALIEMLVEIGLLERYVTPTGAIILHVRGFSRHQKVSHKTDTKYTNLTPYAPKNRAKDATDSGALRSPPESSGALRPEGNGMEGKGTDLPVEEDNTQSSNVVRYIAPRAKP